GALALTFQTSRGLGGTAIVAPSAPIPSAASAARTPSRHRRARPMRKASAQANSGRSRGSAMAAAARVRRRPGLDVIDMVAPGPAVAAAARALSREPHRLERGACDAEVEGVLLGGEEGAGFARGLGARGGVIVHGSGPGSGSCGLDRKRRRL